jgi:hypothetical protein
MVKGFKCGNMAAFFLFFLSLVIYIHNLSIGSFGADVGDFLAASAARGIPHPSGYPLFTLLGIVFSFLPIPFNLAFKVSLVSAISSSFSVVLIYAISLMLTKNKIVSFITALLLAFVYPFWLYAEVAEAFALAYFFVLLLIYLTLKFRETKKLSFFYLLFLSFGLSLSNHQVVILLLPSILILIISASPRIFFNIKRNFICLGLFTMGLLPYLYLPIASYFNPPFYWNHPVILSDFLKLILRQDYGWIPEEIHGFWLSILPVKYLFISLFNNLTPAGIIIILFGMVNLIINKQKILFLALLTAFFLFGPFFVSYGFTDLVSGFNMGVIERFYMFPGLILLIFFPFGVDLIVKLILVFLRKINISKKRITPYASLFTLTFCLIPVYLFFLNFPKTDLHKVRLSDNLAVDILKPLPKNAILFLDKDTPIFNVSYVQYGENFRKDIVAININRVDKNDLFGFLAKKFKKEGKKNDQIAVATIESLSKSRQIYSSKVIDLKYKNKKHWIPEGLLVKMSDKKIGKEEFLKMQNKLWQSYSFKSREDLTISERSLLLAPVPELYSFAAARVGFFLITEYQDLDSSKKYFDKAIDYNPSSQEAHRGLSYYYLLKRKCLLSKDYAVKALTLDRSKKENYVLLSSIFSDCLKDNGGALAIQKEYNKVFKEKMFENKK